MQQEGWAIVMTEVVIERTQVFRCLIAVSSAEDVCHCLWWATNTKGLGEMGPGKKGFGMGLVDWAQQEGRQSLGGGELVAIA